MKKICFHVNKYFPYLGGTEILAKQVVDYISSNSNFSITVKTSPDEKRKINDFLYKIEEDIYLSKEQHFDLNVFFSDLWSHQLQNFNILQNNKNICILNLDEMTYSHKNNLKKAIDNLKKFDCVITFTKDGIANRFLEEENIKNIYIPNFSRDVLKNKPIFNLKEKLKLDNKKIGLYCAAFDIRKNQLSFLQSIKQSENLKNYNWILIGNCTDGVYQNKCIQYVKYNNLKNIYFLAPTADEIKMDTLYQEIDFMVLLSLAEGMPLTLLEGLSANKPSVFTPVGGSKGVLAHCLNNGAYCLEKVNYDIEDLENNVLKASTFSGDNLRETWFKNHNKEMILKQYLNIIKELSWE